MATVTKTVTAALDEMQWRAIDYATASLRFTADERDAFTDKIIRADEATRELMLCAVQPEYFIRRYCQIYDNESSSWIAFELWPEQVDVLELVHRKDKVIGLKARQLGITWLALAYALWQALFAPVAVVLIYSRRDDEAVYLLSEERLRGMYKRLPPFMQAAAIVADNAHTFGLSNGSIIYAFPTTAGDGYTATFVIMDEADLLPNLGALLRRAEPTIDAGGKLLMISRSNKDEPRSLFKAIYNAAKRGASEYAHFFLPWWVRPERTQAWYDAYCASIMESDGSLDKAHEQYPSTDLEALAAASANKRIPGEWLRKCYIEEKPAGTAFEGQPDDPGIRVYRPPEPGRKYAIGADCAEGLPSSDDSVSVVVDVETGEECAVLTGKYTPSMHAAITVALSTWYNKAKVLPENNNHGHAFVAWMTENGHTPRVEIGHNGKLGWTSNAAGKNIMYTEVAQAAKDSDCIIHDPDTYAQLADINKGTLRASPGGMDDHADAYALAIVARGKTVATPAKRPARRISRKMNIWGGPSRGGARP